MESALFYSLSTSQRCFSLYFYNNLKPDVFPIVPCININGYPISIILAQFKPPQKLDKFNEWVYNVETWKEVKMKAFVYTASLGRSVNGIDQELKRVVLAEDLKEADAIMEKKYKQRARNFRVKEKPLEKGFLL